MKEIIDILKDRLEMINNHIDFYKTFIDYKITYSKQLDILYKRRDNYKLAIKLLRGKK